MKNETILSYTALYTVTDLTSLKIIYSRLLFTFIWCLSRGNMLGSRCSDSDKTSRTSQVTGCKRRSEVLCCIYHISPMPSEFSIRFLYSFLDNRIYHIRNLWCCFNLKLIGRHGHSRRTVNTRVQRNFVIQQYVNSPVVHTYS